MEKLINEIKNHLESIFPIDSFPEKKKNNVYKSINEEGIKQQSRYNKTILVDFDGVIHSYHEGYKDGSIYGYVIKGAKEAIEKLKKKGYKIVIFTTRVSPGTNKDYKQQKIDIANWLQKNSIPYDLITSEKLGANYYIDDNAIKFTNWSDVMQKIK